MGSCESGPDADHEQAERDAIQNGDSAEVVSHNIVVGNGSMMERGRPSPGCGQPRDSECAEYQYGDKAEKPDRQSIDPVDYEASPEKRTPRQLDEGGRHRRENSWFSFFYGNYPSVYNTLG